MTAHPVVSEAEWLAARKALLEREKAFTRERDALSAERRALPWVRIVKDYVFTSEQGELRLADLFGPRSQLIAYHFMFHPGWTEGCKNCSFWADTYNPLPQHLAQRDVSFVAVSRAPLATLLAYRRRMGWTFPWVSSAGSDFNFDFRVSFPPDEAKAGAPYNFGTSAFRGEEAPGLSVFFKDADGGIYRTYSCYSRGLDMLNGAYQHLDLVPKGRDEEALPFTMAWVKRHDEYGKA